MGEEAASDPGPPALDRICPWCSAETEPGQTHCPRCGAALAQHETVDSLKILGVTDIDPALVGLETHRTIVVLSSPRGGSVTIIGPMEDLSSRVVDPERVGEPSEAALLAVKRLDRLEPPDESGGEAPSPADSHRSEESR